MKTIPGLNHTYRVGKTFYTLQTDSGLYLSHPQHYRDGTGKRVFDYSDYLTADGATKARLQTTSALTKHWWCAWVTYSLEDLRDVYKYIANRFAKEQEADRPQHPCTGKFVRGRFNLVMCQDLRRLRPSEITVAKETKRQQNQLSLGLSKKPQSTPLQSNIQKTAATHVKPQSKKPVSQLRQQIQRGYAGKLLLSAALPSIPDTSNVSKKRG